MEEVKKGVDVEKVRSEVKEKGNELMMVEEQRLIQTQEQSLTALASKAVQSGILPTWVKSESMAYIVMQKAQELGLKPLSAFDMLYIVNGMATLSARGMAAVIKRHGGRIRTIREGQPVYLTDDPSDFYLRGEVLRDKDGNPQLADSFTITIECTRPDENHEVKHYVHFRWNEASSAGLTTGPTWKKYPHQMMYNRCLSKAGRQVFPDFISGIYMADELDTTNTIAYDEDGNVIKIQ